MHAPRHGSFAVGARGEAGGTTFPTARLKTLDIIKTTISAERPPLPPIAEKGLLWQKWFALAVGQQCHGAGQEGSWGAVRGCVARDAPGGRARLPETSAALPQTTPGHPTPGAGLPHSISVRR